MPSTRFFVQVNCLCVVFCQNSRISVAISVFAEGWGGCEGYDSWHGDTVVTKQRSCRNRAAKTGCWDDSLISIPKPGVMKPRVACTKLIVSRPRLSSASEGGNGMASP